MYRSQIEPQSSLIVMPDKNIPWLQLGTPPLLGLRRYRLRFQEGSPRRPAIAAVAPHWLFRVRLARRVRPCAQAEHMRHRAVRLRCLCPAPLLPLPLCLRKQNAARHEEASALSTHSQPLRLGAGRSWLRLG